MHNVSTKALVLAAVLAVTSLTGCADKALPTVSENTISEQQTEWDSEYYTVYSIGQFTGFKQDGDIVYVYPYYNTDKSVKLELVHLSENNIWYDFVTSNGLTMADVEKFDSGVQQFTSGGKTYGYIQITTSLGLLATTDSLTPDYVKMVLEHIG